jgi:peptidoglycan/xylan/chitin deacetylase (PgdA/CDA1 family)
MDWLKTGIRTAFLRMGGMHAVRYSHRKALRILMYHRFPGKAALEEQCSHFVRHYRLLSMTEAAANLRPGGSIPCNSLAITVDDGYRDFFLVAYPVFRAFRIPVTVFLATDFVDGTAWLWTDIVRYVCANTAAAEVNIADASLELRFPLDSAESRRRASSAVTEALKRMPNSERLRVVADFPQSLRVALPARPPQEYAPLTWDEVRSMADGGIVFGAHTRSHPILSRVAECAELRSEIQGSRARIEEELQRPVVHFCYPNGGKEDISPAAIEEARRAGFETAVTTSIGLNHPGCDPFTLRRIGVEPDLPRFYFERAVAGYVR